MPKKRRARRNTTRASRGSKTPASNHGFDRLQVLTIIFFLVTGIIVVRLFIVQVLQHNFYVALAEGQHELYQKLLPERGEIFTRNAFTGELEKLVTNREMNTVYAVPRDIEDPKWAAEQLAPIVGVDEKELQERLTGDRLYTPLKKRVSDEEWGVIEEMGIKGVAVTTEWWRFYPEGSVFSHVTGFLGIKDDLPTGQYGLEGYYEEDLSGTQGYIRSERDSAGALIAAGDMLIEEAVDGDDLVLTLDKAVQYHACSALEESVERLEAKSGTVLIMNPETGAIITMCNAPGFDPNNYNLVDSIEVFNNAAVIDTYEPGSVFKAFAIGAALDQGKITPNTTYEDTGVAKIAGYNIRNSDGKANGVVDMTFVLSESLNTGSIFAVQQIGNELWYDYLQKLGFGELTGIRTTGERAGDISAVGKLEDIYSATSSYGQGLTATPLQVLAAYGSIANDGKLMRPFLIQEIVKPNGFVVETKPSEVRRVYSAKAAQTLAAMLVNVIDSGHATKAAVEGYYMAGKTGTAQVPRKDGPGYSATRHKDTFVGFGPISDPKFVMLVKIDEPKNVMWSADSAAPLWGEIADFLVEYYHIPPDR